MCLSSKAILTCSFVYAEEQVSQHNTGYVNIRKILATAPQIEQIQKKLANEFEGERQSIIALRSEIATLNNNYDELVARQSDGNTKKELQQLQKLIDSKQLSLIKKQQLMQDDFNTRRNEELAKLQTLVVHMVAKVAKAKGLEMVLNNTGVIYVNSRIDITPEVFKYLAEHNIE